MRKPHLKNAEILLHTCLRRCCRPCWKHGRMPTPPRSSAVSLPCLHSNTWLQSAFRSSEFLPQIQELPQLCFRSTTATEQQHLQILVWPGRPVAVDKALQWRCGNQRPPFQLQSTRRWIIRIAPPRTAVWTTASSATKDCSFDCACIASEYNVQNEDNEEPSTLNPKPSTWLMG